MSFEDKIAEQIDLLRQRAADGLTLAEASESFHGFVDVAVEAATQLINKGVEKKAIVLLQLGFAIDALATGISLPLLLQWTRPFVVFALKPLLLQIASGAIEAAVSRLPKPKPPAPVPAE